MSKKNYRTLLAPAAMSIFAVAGCSAISAVSTEQASKYAGMDISLFKEGAFSQEPKIVDCETAEGSKTTCYELVTVGAPGMREPGPFCPRTTADSADAGGAWFRKEGSGDLVDISGEFILNLSSYYDDPNWKLYDPETDKVRYTDSKASCLGAAKPDVEDAYKQNCIECLMSYLDEDFSRRYLIPTTPIPSSEGGSRLRTAGIALDGAELSGPAPVDAILGAYTIAAFDDCGGHINTHQGYHYHSSTGCVDTPTSQDGHASLVGYAPDGYGIFAMKNAEGREETLDECRGTSDEVRGYHYHAASPSENMIIGCLKGESVRPAREAHGAGGPPPKDDGGEPDKK